MQALYRWGEAVAVYQRVLEQEPSNAWVHTYLGYVLVELGDLDRLDLAAEHCRRAIELAPELGEPHTNLGFVYAAMGQPEEALGCYRRAIELAPYLAMPWNNIGRAEQELGRFDAAAAAYQKALDLEPRSARFHANYGWLLLEQERNGDAVARYRLALEYEPNFAEAHHGLAAALVALGRREEATASLALAHRLRPGLPGPRIVLGRMHSEDGDFDQAAAHARSVLADYPMSADAYFLLAGAQREKVADADLEMMITLLDHPHYNDFGVASLAFAIAAVQDARRCYEKAAVLRHWQCASGGDASPPWPGV